MSDKPNKRKLFEAQPNFIKAGLYSNKKYQAVRQQAFHQRYFVCELLRQNGNAYYKQGQFQSASSQYEESLSIFRFIKSKRENWKKEGIFDEDLTYVHYTGNNDKEKQMLDQMKLGLYLNLAAAYMRLNDNDNAARACDEALIISPKNTKALFRRARARSSGEQNITLQQYNLALEDIQLAHSLNKEDIEIKDELLRITKEYYSALQAARDQQLASQSELQQQQQQPFSQQQPVSPLQMTPLNTGQQKFPPAGGHQTNFTSNQPANTSSQLGRGIQLRKKQPRQYNYSGKNVGANEDQFSNNNSNNNSQQQSPSASASNQNCSFSKQDLENLDFSQLSNEEMEEFIRMNRQQNQGTREGNIQQPLSQDAANKQAQDFWKMLNINKDYDNFDYELSYEIDPNAKVPKEIEDLGKFIKNRGKEMIKLFENAGKKQEALELKEKLGKAMAAKNQLEKIAKLDFSKPTRKLQELANKFGIDIHDESIKSEFKKIQNQNLEDIRAWLAQNDVQSQSTPQVSGSSSTKQKNQEGKSDNFLQCNSTNGNGNASSKSKKNNIAKESESSFAKQGNVSQSHLKQQQQSVVINNNYYNQTFNNNQQVTNNYYGANQNNKADKNYSQNKDESKVNYRKPNQPSPATSNAAFKNSAATASLSPTSINDYEGEIELDDNGKDRLNKQTVINDYLHTLNNDNIKDSDDEDDDNDEDHNQETQQQKLLTGNNDLSAINKRKKKNSDDSDKENCGLMNQIIVIISICLFLFTIILHLCNSDDSKNKLK